MYKILRTLLFFFPAEGVHHFSMKALKLLCGWGPGRRLVAWGCRPEGGAPAGAGKAETDDPRVLSRACLGLKFRNPVGLGAGFDKNALYLRELDALGFGFVEIGTVTPKPQAGNELPRLFRLPQDQALVNRMGFNNDGMEVIAARLRAWRAASAGFSRADGSQTANGRPVGEGAGDAGNRGAGGKMPRMIIGGNLGKNKVTPNEDAWKDYELCFRALFGLVDYFVVNVSSPNTPGLRELQDKEALRQLLTNLQRVRAELCGKVTGRSGEVPGFSGEVPGLSGQAQALSGGAQAMQGDIPAPPILLKIAPDLNQQQLDDVIALAEAIGLDGLVATNTTVSREGLITEARQVEAIGTGGLSGAPLRERATEVVRYLCERTGGRIPVVASGGIFTAANAQEKIDAGAALVQVWTGFIYEGPFIVGRICRRLVVPRAPGPVQL